MHTTAYPCIPGDMLANRDKLDIGSAVWEDADSRDPHRVRGLMGADCFSVVGVPPANVVMTVRPTETTEGHAS